MKTGTKNHEHDQSRRKLNDAWEKVINKQARYRFVIDASTF